MRLESELHRLFCLFSIFTVCKAIAPASYCSHLKSLSSGVFLRNHWKSVVGKMTISDFFLLLWILGFLGYSEKYDLFWRAETLFENRKRALFSIWTNSYVCHNVCDVLFVCMQYQINWIRRKIMCHFQNALNAKINQRTHSNIPN